MEPPIVFETVSVGQQSETTGDVTDMATVPAGSQTLTGLASEFVGALTQAPKDSSGGRAQSQDSDIKKLAALGHPQCAYALLTRTLINTWHRTMRCTRVSADLFQPLEDALSS